MKHDSSYKFYLSLKKYILKQELVTFEIEKNPFLHFNSQMCRSLSQNFVLLTDNWNCIS